MNSELKKRFLFTLMILFIYRLGTYIPLPGIDGQVISEFFSKNSNTFFGLINMFSGGAFQRMSIFALNIMPYITSSIIIQLLGSIYKSVDELRKEGELGRRKLNQYTKYLTLFLGTCQSIGIYFAFSNLEQSAFISDSRLFLWTTVFSLLGSTMLLMWLGDKITYQGLGNGISLLIFIGIVAELPSNITKIIDLAKSAKYPWAFMSLLIIAIVILTTFIVFFEKSVRNVKIQYSTGRGMMINNKDISYIPLKINISGVIPPIFTNSILVFPLIILQFFSKNQKLIKSLSELLAKDSLFYLIIFSALVIFFSYFYSAIVFNTEELAENLKKSNCFIPGIRPGINTKIYIDNIVDRLTFIGAIYLLIVCIIPDLFFAKFSVKLSVGGTSLLIMVSTVIDLITQIQAHIFSDKYVSVNKRRRIKVNNV